jgi:hypothetical protein
MLKIHGLSCQRCLQCSEVIVKHKRSLIAEVNEHNSKSWFYFGTNLSQYHGLLRDGGSNYYSLLWWAFDVASYKCWMVAIGSVFWGFGFGM